MPVSDMSNLIIVRVRTSISAFNSYILPVGAGLYSPPSMAAFWQRWFISLTPDVVQPYWYVSTGGADLIHGYHYAISSEHSRSMYISVSVLKLRWGLFLPAAWREAQSSLGIYTVSQLKWRRNSNLHKQNITQLSLISVSYTHLTLPTTPYV